MNDAARGCIRHHKTALELLASLAQTPLVVDMVAYHTEQLRRARKVLNKQGIDRVRTRLEVAVTIPPGVDTDEVDDILVGIETKENRLKFAALLADYAAFSARQ